MICAVCPGSTTSPAQEPVALSAKGLPRQVLYGAKRVMLATAFATKQCPMQIRDVFSALWDHPDDKCYLTRQQHITFGEKGFV